MNKALRGPHLLIVSPLWTDGLLNTSSFSLEEEEELESGGSAEFTCFSEDLVAEQLTYMDAVGLSLYLRRASTENMENNTSGPRGQWAALGNVLELLLSR